MDLNFFYHMTIICYGMQRKIRVCKREEHNRRHDWLYCITKAITTLDENFKALGVFLDFHKAFDCLENGILFYRFYGMGVRC